MATLKEYEKLSVKERQHRFFSEEFKRKKVNEIERKLTIVSEICQEYQVSRAAVYKWIYRYSRMKKKQERLVLESLSDTRKIISLKERIKELEGVVGRKQLHIDFLEKMIDIAGEDLGIDIKKKVSTDALNGSGQIVKNTRSK